MNSITTTGIICLKDHYNILYKIAKITYKEYQNEEYEYLFEPFYNIIDFLPSDIFQGIPGIDLSLKKSVYIRKNMTPVFISERTPSENREDLQALLEENNMSSLNRLEWLIRTNSQYCGDNLFVIPYLGNKFATQTVDSMYDLVKKSDSIKKELLNIICAGDDLYSNEITINNTNRSDYYKLLISLYMKEYEAKKARIKEGIKKAKEDNVYKGRKKIEMDEFNFNHIKDEFLNKKISAEKAAKLLNISRSTFLRRLKEEKN